MAAPGAISAANELIGTAVNGQNLSGSFNAGAFFEPLPGMITSWYTWLGNSLTWANLAAAVPKINYSYAASYRVFNYSLPNQSLDLNCNLGMNLGVMFTPLDGTFKGSLGGTGKANLDVSIPGASGVEVSVEGNLGLTGTLQGAFAGLNPPTFTPSWRVTANVTDGVKMPAVSFVPAVLPAAAPAITFLQNTWGIKSIINSIKLGATLTEGGSLTGVYQNGALGSCFLKTTKLNGSLNAGLKLEASAKLGPAKAKSTVGVMARSLLTSARNSISRVLRWKHTPVFPQARWFLVTTRSFRPCLPSGVSRTHCRWTTSALRRTRMLAAPGNPSAPAFPTGAHPTN